MLALKCVTTKSYDFKNGLYPVVKEYAEIAYRDQYKDLLKETTKFRDSALKITQYKKESDIDAWMMYYSRLMGIIKDFPCVNYFKWNVIFPWYSANVYKTSVKSSNIFVELAATLYNIAILYAQKGHVVIDVEMDSTVLQDSINSLQSALNYISLILNDVQCFVSDAETLPELQRSYLEYLKSLLCAEVQYLKALKLYQRGNDTKNRNAFVVLLAGASHLYEDAITFFQKCDVDMPDVCQFLNAMKELTYMQALYYMSYMSKEELEDFSNHGSGVAAACLRELMATITKIRTIPKTVLAPIARILDDIELQARQQNKVISEAWMIRQSTVPESLTYKLEERIIVHPELLELTAPVLHYEHFISAAMRQRLEQEIKAYESFVDRRMKELQGRFEESVKRACEWIEETSYDSMIAASKKIGVIPNDMNEKVLHIQKREEENYAQKCKEQYHYQCKGFTNALEEMKGLQADLIRAMNIHSERFTEEHRTYFTTTLSEALAKYTQFMDILEIKERETKQWVKFQDDPYYKLLKPSGMELLQSVMETEIDIGDRGESARNNLLTLYSRFQAMINTAKEYKARAEHIAKTTYLLRADFVSRTNEGDTQDRFELYFTPCQKEMESALTILDTYSKYIPAIHEAISLLAREVDCIPIYKKRYQALIGLKRAISTYNGLAWFYSENAKTTQVYKKQLESYYTSLLPYIKL